VFAGRFCGGPIIVCRQRVRWVGVNPGSRMFYDRFEGRDALAAAEDAVASALDE
jgi:hypothetical protein